MSLYVDRRGRLISEDEWATRFLSRDYRRILCDNLEFSGRKVEILTAWGGTIDHGLQPFQTDVYVTVGGEEQHFGCYGWSSCREAIQGHRQILSLYQEIP